MTRINRRSRSNRRSRRKRRSQKGGFLGWLNPFKKKEGEEGATETKAAEGGAEDVLGEEVSQFGGRRRRKSRRRKSRKRKSRGGKRKKSRRKRKSRRRRRR
jgi:hypothetical protein